MPIKKLRQAKPARTIALKTPFRGDTRPAISPAPHGNLKNSRTESHAFARRAAEGYRHGRLVRLTPPRTRFLNAARTTCFRYARKFRFAIQAKQQTCREHAFMFLYVIILTNKQKNVKRFRYFSRYCLVWFILERAFY